MKKARVTYFMNGFLKTKDFNFVGWYCVITDINTDNDGEYVNEIDILSIELIPIK